MYIKADLVLSSYKPLFLERGMFFKKENGELWELNFIPDNIEKFIVDNGYPVECYIILDKQLLAFPQEIEWIESEDSFNEVTIEDLNYIILDCEGKLRINAEEKEELFVPVYIDNKVIIKFIE